MLAQLCFMSLCLICAFTVEGTAAYYQTVPRLIVSFGLADVFVSTLNGNLAYATVNVIWLRLVWEAVRR
jgi:hypothetical protein